MLCGKRAIAVAFPSPKDYILVIGNSINERCAALKAMDTFPGGAVVIENGQIKASLSLDIYGMMFSGSLEDLKEQSQGIDYVAEQLGYTPEGEPLINKLLSLAISLDRFHF